MVRIVVEDAGLEEDSRIVPDVVYNRFGSVYGRYTLLELEGKGRCLSVPLHVEGRLARLGLYLADISSEEAEELCSFVFSHFPVSRINWDYSLSPLGGRFVHRNHATNHWKVELPQTADELWARMSRKSRYNRRREERTLMERLGCTELAVTEYEGAGIPLSVVEAFFSFKRTLMGRDYGLSPAEYLSHYHVSHAYTWTAGERLVAIVFSCEQGKDVFLENLTYDPELEEFSPGFHLYALVLERLIGKGKSAIFLGGGSQPYKARFGGIEQHCCNVEAYRNVIVAAPYYLAKLVARMRGRRGKGSGNPHDGGEKAAGGEGRSGGSGGQAKSAGAADGRDRGGRASSDRNSAGTSGQDRAGHNRADRVGRAPVAPSSAGGHAYGISGFFRKAFRYVRIRAKWAWQRAFFSLVPIRGALNRESRPFSITVSLTSFPPRLSSLHLCIKSLMRQTLKPDRIVLYLGADCDGVKLPRSLAALCRKGLTIRNVGGDLRPHKKYLYAMREFPDDYIVTVDDDLMFCRDMLEGLWKAHLSHPDALVANRVHLMKAAGGRILPYRDWLQETGSVREPTHALLSTNGAGSLFPPRCLPPEALDGELARELCLNADDIWLKFMLIRGGTKVLWAGKKATMPDEIRIKAGRKQALMDTNLTGGGNDGYISAMESFFKMNLADYCR